MAVGRPKGPLSDEQKKKQEETRMHTKFLKNEIHPGMDMSLFTKAEFQAKVIASVEYKFPFTVKEPGLSKQLEDFAKLFLEAKNNRIPYMELFAHYEYEYGVKDIDRMCKELIKAEEAWIQCEDASLPHNKKVYRYYGTEEPKDWKGYKYTPRESKTQDEQ